MKPQFPARIHVLLARESSTAVVIRRGPAHRTAFIGWDRCTDQFSVGQWLNGRIYERRSDLSPDGRHLIYFALNGKWADATQGSWTAVSRAPYLKALSLFALGHTWAGGGLFLSDDTYWLADIQGSGHQTVHDDSGLTRSTDSLCSTGDFYQFRLQRDGWRLTGVIGKDSVPTQLNFEKPLTPNILLQKRSVQHGGRVVGRGQAYDEHQLMNRATGETLDCPDWEWAEVDGGRLVWAQGGKLFAGRVPRLQPEGVKLLADFNLLRYHRLRAPY